MKATLCSKTAIAVISLELLAVCYGQLVLNVAGPNLVFLGDANKYTCTGAHDHQDVKWYYKLKDGKHEEVSPSDILEDYISQEPQSRMSYIKINHMEIVSLICKSQSESDTEGELPLKVENHVRVSKFSNPCEKTEDSPSIILERFNYQLTSQDWPATYVTNKTVNINEEVFQIKLTCSSESKPLIWSMREVDEKDELMERASNKSFRSWTIEYSMNNTRGQRNCYKSVLEVGPPFCKIDRVYDCRALNSTEDYQSSVKIIKADACATKINITHVEQCVELITQIITGTNSNGGLTGISITSTLMSVLLLYGILHFKRQLNAHKEKLKEMVSGSTNNL